MSLTERSSRELSKAFGLFAIAYGMIVGVIALLVQMGLPGSTAGALIASVALAAFVAIGLAARTMDLPDFQVASHRVPAVFNGMAGAAAFLASAGFLGLAGAFFGGDGTELAVVAGWTTGFLVLSVLIAPYLRKAAAVSVADFLAIRFGGSVVRLAAVIVTVVCSFGFLTAELSAAGHIATTLFGLSHEAGIGIALAAILAASLLGGMRTVTLTAIAQYIVLVIAFVTPVAVLSFYDYGIPIPQVTYGYALREAAELGGSEVGAAASRFLPLPPLDGFNMVVLAVSLAAGVASLPHILARSTTATTPFSARRSAGWMLLFVLIVVATAPAYGAFTRLALAVDPSLGPIDADAVVLRVPELAGLSPAMTGLVTTGALAATLAAATALLFAIANTLGHDLYGKLVDRHGPAGRQLIVTRITLIAVASLAAWYAAAAGDDIFALAATSLSLAAAGLFPALLLGIWWKQTTTLGAFAGIVLGFAAAAAYVGAVLHGHMAPWQPLGSLGSELPPMAAAFFGLPVGILTIVFVSQITPEPSPERIEITDAIRQPDPSPLIES